MVAFESEGVVVGTVGGLAPTEVTVVTGTVVEGVVVVLVANVVDGIVEDGGGGNVDEVVDDVVSGIVVDGNVVDGSVVDGSVVDGNVVDGSVVDGNVVDGNVVDGSVVDGNVVDGSVVDGSVVDGSVVDGSVVDGNVVDGSVVVGSVVVGVQHFTVVVVFHVVEVTGLVVVVHHQFQFHVVVVTPWWRDWSTTLDFNVFADVHVPGPTLFPLWLVDALDVRAGSAIRLSATTAIAANADRELLSNRVVVARHIPTNCRKVNA